MKKRKVLTMLLTLCLLLSAMIMPVSASQSSSNDAILEARKGILQVAVLIRIDNEDFGYTHVGTGFLIGGSDGAQTVITNYHVAHALTEWDVRSLLGLADNVKVDLQLRIVVKRDVFIGASIVNESQKGDFAILKLEQPIYDRAPLILADSDEVQTTQEVYALGFPGIVQDIQSDEVYTSDDVTVTSGIVSKTNAVTLVDVAIPCITHSARLAEGNSGGPLVDKNGYVIGVNTIISNDRENNNDYFFSTQINEVRDVLDALGIEYQKADSAPTTVETTAPETTAPETTAPETTAPETENPLFDDLKAAINSANAVSLEGMTQDSAANFRAALNAAEATYRNSSASNAEIEKAISDLNIAKNGLVEDKGVSTTLIIIIAAAVIVVIIVVIVIIVVVSSGKKKKAAAASAQQRAAAARPAGPQPIMPGGGPQPGMGGPQGGWNQQPPRQPMPQQGGYQQPPHGGPAPFNAGSDGSAETSVLNDGAGETTLLGGGAGLPPAYLVRKKNNERVTISKQVFKLGKERRRVDYCIADNTNVSRAHADIVFKNGEFYIVDNNATNGTTVNGAAVAAGQERRLNNGDIIRLADEEFRFQL